MYTWITMLTVRNQRTPDLTSVVKIDWTIVYARIVGDATRRFIK